MNTWFPTYVVIPVLLALGIAVIAMALWSCWRDKP